MTDHVATEAGTAPPAWGAPRSKTVSWYDPRLTAEAGRHLSGLEFLRSLRDGELPPPPIIELLGLRLVDVELGMAVFEADPDESLYNPIGVVHGGLVCTLADSAIGCAVHSTLEAGIRYTSIDLNVSYLRPVTEDSRTLRATGVVTKTGSRVAFASATIIDAAGRIVATATGTCLVIPPDREVHP